MSPPKIPPVIVDINALVEPFRLSVQAMLAEAAELHLPVKLYETRRALERQRWLFDKGYSKAAGANGPHPWGLAADIILDPKSPEWSDIGDRPIAVDGGAAPWDTGYNRVGGGMGVILVRRGVAHVVRELGRLAAKHGVEWGGVNAGGWANSASGAEFGWDPFHFQAARWKRLLPHLPSPR